MSEAGKVLHLYVEVRSVPEKDGKVTGRADGTNPLMLQYPDIQPNSQRSSTCSSPSRSPAFSPDENHTLPSSKASSRHSVSFQLQNPHGRRSSTQEHHQDVLYDGFDEFLHVLTPGKASPSHHNSSGPVWLHVPSTVTSSCTSVNVPKMEKEKSSVVTFGYIDKATVHSVEGRTEPDTQPLPAQLRKRLSDPTWYSPGHSDPYSNQPCPSRGSPHQQRATLDAVARQATHKALEEFGSPELRRRFVSCGPENYSPSLPRHFPPPRCQTLGGSPVLPRSTLTLPSKAQLLETLPRSPASDHLCAHAGSAASPFQSHGFSQSQHRSWVKDESPRLHSIFYPPLSAGKPTDIQHEMHSSSFTPNHQPQADYQSRGTSQHNARADDGPQYHANSNTSNNNLYIASHGSSRASDVLSPTSGRSSISPSSNREMACKLAVEATKLCSVYAERRTPSPTPSEAQWSESPKAGGPRHRGLCPGPLQANTQNHRWKTDQAPPQTRPGRASPLLPQKAPPSPSSPAVPASWHRAQASQSPVLDPRQQWSSSPSKDASTVHRYQPPQFTGDCKSRSTVQRQYHHLCDPSTKDSPDGPRRLGFSQNIEALPVSWASRHVEWREVRGDSLSPSSIYTPSNDQCLGSKGGKMCVQVGPSRDERDEALYGSHGAASSQSSSGVTGSVGDESPLDRYCSLSPETSSQSSHDTADSGKQVG